MQHSCKYCKTKNINHVNIQASARWKDALRTTTRTLMWTKNEAGLPINQPSIIFQNHNGCALSNSQTISQHEYTAHYTSFLIKALPRGTIIWTNLVGIL